MRQVMTRSVSWLLILCGLSLTLRAEDLNKTTSLRFVPASAAFFTSSLRLGEQYDVFVKSRAYEQLAQLPGVQLGLSLLDAQYRKSDFTPIRNFLKQKENKELVALLSDAVASEVFVYGDVGLVELMTLLQDISNQGRMASAQVELANQEDSEQAQLEIVRGILQRLNNNHEKLRLSPFVFGAKVSDTERALRQIGRLQPILEQVAPALEDDVKVTFARTKIGTGGDFLTLTIDLGSIDWSELEETIPEDLQGDASTLIDFLKTKKVTVALGVQDGYLLFSMAEGIGHLQTLGEGDSLGDIPEFQKVLQHQDQRVTSLWYASKAISSVQQQSAASQAMMVSGFLRAAMSSSNTPEATKKEFEKDLKVLEDKITEEMSIPPHATVGCSFLTARGSETFNYQVGEFAGTGGTPLPILQHVGGDPLLFNATRTPMSVAEYDELRPIFQKLYEYANIAVLSNIDEDDKEKYEHIRDLAVPVAQKLDTILHDHLVPALADGQRAFVIDSKIESKQWLRDMPESSQPLPMFEFSMVLGITSADQFKEGVYSLYQLFGEIMQILHKENPDEFPEFTLPQIEEKSGGDAGGELFSLVMPDEAGIDPQVAGCLGVSADFAIFTTSVPQVARVLKETPFKFQGPLAGHPEKLLNARHFNFARVIETIQPWVGYGFEVALAQSGEESNFAVEAVHGQIDTILEVLKCYRGTSSISYEEKGAIVTHSESHFEDLAAE